MSDLKAKILVIDDEKAIRRSFQLTFQDTDYYIDLAENGIEGVNKLELQRYDVIFLDLIMPVMNGIDFLKKMRVNKVYTPVYIITSFHEEYFAQLLQLRKEGYTFEILQKPLRNKDLIDSVESIINSLKT